MHRKGRIAEESVGMTDRRGLVKIRAFARLSTNELRDRRVFESIIAIS